MHDRSAIVEDEVYKIRNEATGNYLRAYQHLVSVSFNGFDTFKVRLRSVHIHFVH
jgi:hypothetical protein